MRKEFIKIVAVATFSVFLMVFVFSYNGLSQTPSIIENEQQDVTNIYPDPKLTRIIKGSGKNGLKEPLNVIVSSDGRIIVADKGDGQVKIFDKDGRFLNKIEGKSESSRFRYPYGLAITAKGDLLVSDSENHTVQQFNINGEFIKEIITPSEKIRPGAMLIKDKQVYIADLANHKILLYDEKGNKVNQIAANLSFPHGLAVDKQKKLWIGDAGQIPSLKVLTGAGILQNQYDLDQDQKNYFKTIRGLAIDSKDRVYVTDAMANKVLVFDIKGKLLYQFAGTGSGENQFNFPSGVFIDQEDRIYIADRMNKRIQVFSY